MRWAHLGARNAGSCWLSAQFQVRRCDIQRQVRHVDLGHRGAGRTVTRDGGTIQRRTRWSASAAALLRVGRVEVMWERIEVPLGPNVPGEIKRACDPAIAGYSAWPPPLGTPNVDRTRHLLLGLVDVRHGIHPSIPTQSLRLSLKDRSEKFLKPGRLFGPGTARNSRRTSRGCQPVGRTAFASSRAA